MQNINVVIEGFEVLCKAGSTQNGLIPVRCIAHAMELDRQNDEVEPSALNKAAPGFMKVGVLDWYHLSQRGKTEEERRHNIIGTPSKFGWENENGKQVPVVYGNLTKAHPIVARDMAPHLEAGNPVFQASLGGYVTRRAPLAKAGGGRVIQEMNWTHLALAPRNSVISPGSMVSIAKAEGIGEYLHVDSVPYVHYQSPGAFWMDVQAADAGHVSILSKALEAGYATDPLQSVGFQPLQSESLSGGPDRYLDLANALKANLIANTLEGLTFYFTRVCGLPLSAVPPEIDNFRNYLSSMTRAA